jgi:hypothetical protein
MLMIGRCGPELFGTWNDIFLPDDLFFFLHEFFGRNDRFVVAPSAINVVVIDDKKSR